MGQASLGLKSGFDLPEAGQLAGLPIDCIVYACLSYMRVES